MAYSEISSGKSRFRAHGIAFRENKGTPRGKLALGKGERSARKEDYIEFPQNAGV